jgi:hypothetical protein
MLWTPVASYTGNLTLPLLAVLALLVFLMV